MSECFFDNRVKEAVYIASSDLYKELEKLFSSKVKDEDRKNGIEISFMKYLSRMSTRCTPFGLFATSSVGNIGEVTQFSLDDEISRCTRLDMYYLCALVQTILSLPDVKRGVYIIRIILFTKWASICAISNINIQIRDECILFRLLNDRNI